jgi:hypothetical protein
MTNEEIFAAWSPESSIWSTWAKPVLFAHLDTAIVLPPSTEASHDANWAPPPGEKIALVLDLPAEEGVHVGLALAHRGYRPVPLYNALPLPFGAPVFDPLSHRSIAAVNVLPIIGALRDAAGPLASMSIPPDAPPAFLLDANRYGNGSRMLPDEFDNRSVCFTTDFPSANFLVTHGIQRILIVQKDSIEPQPDLAQVLRRWQDGGLPLERMRIDLPMERERFQVSRPSWYGAMFQRALSALGLRRAPGGGFGAWMPDSSAGG